MFHDGASFSPPAEEEVPKDGVGPARVYRCPKHDVEFSVVWMQSFAAWVGECPQCKPIPHEPEIPVGPAEQEEVYELLTAVNGERLR